MSSEAISSTQKGNALEDSFYTYLKEQIEAKELVYGVYPASNCKLFKKKKYYCNQRDGDVEFDVVLEIFRSNKQEPHLYIFFECKNYKSNVPETEIRDFSDKLSDIARDNSKGVIVTSSKLQKGAFNIAKKRGIGVVKFDAEGLDVFLERRAPNYWSKGHLQKKIIANKYSTTPLKFSAYFDGRSYDRPVSLITAILENSDSAKFAIENIKKIPFISRSDLERKAEYYLSEIGYKQGSVDLEALCEYLKIELVREDQPLRIQGQEVLGKADFENRKIVIYSHEDECRNRFTLGHEIGHFVLKHDQYIASDTVLLQDLVEDKSSSEELGKLEFQANYLSSCLLLPKEAFFYELARLGDELGFRDKGAGYIYVDKQACNLLPYNQLIVSLEFIFDVSKTVIEIRLKQFGLLNDNRRFEGFHRAASSQ